MVRKVQSRSTPASALAIVEKNWFSALWFQAAWCSCVLGRGDWLPLTLALIGFHYAAVADFRREVARVWPCAALGIGTDLCLSLGGVFDFGDAVFPLWMACLWVVFPAALPRAFAFLSAQWWRPVLLGGLVPLTYLAGERLGALALPVGPVFTFAALAPIWAALLPALVRLSNRPKARPA